MKRGGLRIYATGAYARRSGARDENTTVIPSRKRRGPDGETEAGERGGEKNELKGRASIPSL